MPYVGINRKDSEWYIEHDRFNVALMVCKTTVNLFMDIYKCNTLWKNLLQRHISLL